MRKLTDCKGIWSIINSTSKPCDLITYNVISLSGHFFFFCSFEFLISISVYIFNRKDHLNLVKGNTWSPYNLQFSRDRTSYCSNYYFIIHLHCWFRIALLIYLVFPCAGWRIPPFVEPSPDGHGGPPGHYWCADSSAGDWPYTTSGPWGPEWGGSYSYGSSYSKAKHYWEPKHLHNSYHTSACSYPSTCPYLWSPSTHPHPSLSPTIPSPTLHPSCSPTITPPTPHPYPRSDIHPPTPRSFPEVSPIPSFDLGIHLTPPDMQQEPPSDSMSIGPSSAIDPPHVQVE